MWWKPRTALDASAAPVRTEQSHTYHEEMTSPVPLPLPSLRPLPPPPYSLLSAARSPYVSVNHLRPYLPVPPPTQSRTPLNFVTPIRYPHMFRVSKHIPSRKTSISCHGSRQPPKDSRWLEMLATVHPLSWGDTPSAKLVVSISWIARRDVQHLRYSYVIIRNTLYRRQPKPL